MRDEVMVQGSGFMVQGSRLKKIWFDLVGSATAAKLSKLRKPVLDSCQAGTERVAGSGEGKDEGWGNEAVTLVTLVTLGRLFASTRAGTRRFEN